MTASGKQSQILLTIHGFHKTTDQERYIPATVFKAKFSELLAALKDADKTVNSKGAHEFLVCHLAIGSAEFGLQERHLPAANYDPISSVGALFECANAIYRSNYAVARRYNGVAERLQKLVHGVEEKFDYMEFTDPEVGSITFDAVFKSQVDQFIAEKAKPSDARPRHFRGESFDSFDCEFLELDFRGRHSRGILVPMGTRMEIPCLFSENFPEAEMKSFLKQRIWAMGNAIYDGSRQLPVRIEVARMQHINQIGRPSDWKGAIKPFESSDWEVGNDIQ